MFYSTGIETLTLNSGNTNQWEGSVQLTSSLSFNDGNLSVRGDQLYQAFPFYWYSLLYPAFPLPTLETPWTLGTPWTLNYKTFYGHNSFLNKQIYSTGQWPMHCLSCNPFNLSNDLAQSYTT
jgi:hypothetical protein